MGGGAADQAGVEVVAPGALLPWFVPNDRMPVAAIGQAVYPSMAGGSRLSCQATQPQGNRILLINLVKDTAQVRLIPARFRV